MMTQDGQDIVILTSFTGDACAATRTRQPLLRRRPDRSHCALKHGSDDRRLPAVLHWLFDRLVSRGLDQCGEIGARKPARRCGDRGKIGMSDPPYREAMLGGSRRGPDARAAGQEEAIETAGPPKGGVDQPGKIGCATDGNASVSLRELVALEPQKPHAAPQVKINPRPRRSRKDASCSLATCYRHQCRALQPAASLGAE